MALGYQQPNYYQPQGYMPQYSGYQPMQTQAPQTQQAMLNGKVVESRDIVSATEIPFNSYGVFPQADLKRVYIKQWCQDGTTKITEYQIIEESNNEKETPDINDILTEIQDSIASLTKKVDKIKPTSTRTMTSKKKGVVDLDDEDE